MPTLTFERESTTSKTVPFEARQLIVGGMSGRDRAAVQHHIDELVELGITPPSSIPVYYRASAEIITQTNHLQVLGPDTSGEVEFALLAFDDGLWFTVASDQTDRKAEAISIALSKQLAGKVLGRTAWRVDDFADRWDSLEMRSWATIDGEKVLYQETALGDILTPADLIAQYGADRLAPGTVMLSGTPAAIGGIRPADRFDMEIVDPTTGRRIDHGYTIEALPVVE